MKEFSSFTMIRQPVNRMWNTMRDRLPEIGLSLEDLKGIETLERHADDGTVRLLNRWSAKQEVPSMLRSALGTSSIEWLDHAVWRESEKECVWSIEPSVLKGHIECGGKTRYELAMAGRGTRVTFEGSFNLTPGFAGKLSGGLEPVIARFVESIVVTVIPRSLSRAVHAAADLIAAGDRGDSSN
jgi:hypothetical protein